jgi:hypothetical protein
MITLYNTDQKTILATIKNKEVKIYATTEDFIGIDKYEIRPLYASASSKLSQLHSECKIDDNRTRINFFDKINDSEYFLFDTVIGFYNSDAAANFAVNAAMGR